MRNSSGKRSGNKTYRIIGNSFAKKSFALIVVLFIVTGSLLAFADSPIENNSIGTSRLLDSTLVYRNGTYYVTVQYYHATCGRPFSGANVTVTFSPAKPSNGYISGNKTHYVNITLNQTGMGTGSFKSDKMWCCRISESHCGASVFPTNSPNYSYMSYSTVYDKGLAYKGYLELVYASSNFTKAPMRQYRLLESDGATINLGCLGNFYHKVIKLSYPPTTKNIYGVLEDKVNGSWTSSNLVTNDDSTIFLVMKQNESASDANYKVLLYSVPSVSSLTSGVFYEYIHSLSIFFLIFVIILSIFTFGIPVSSGQAEFYLSMPYNKRQYFTGKYLTAIIALLATTMITLLVSYESVEFLDGTFPPLNYMLRLFILFEMLGLMGISFTFMFASKTTSLTKIIAYPLVSVMFLYYVLGKLISTVSGLMGIESALTIKEISLVDPFSAYTIYVNSKFPSLGGAVCAFRLPFPETVYLILPWVIIPLIIGLILWHRKF